MKNNKIIIGFIVVGVVLLISANDKTTDDLGQNEYLTIGEAQQAAQQMGCPGYHTHTERSYIYYMPCVSHNYYTQLKNTTIGGGY